MIADDESATASIHGHAASYNFSSVHGSLAENSCTMDRTRQGIQETTNTQHETDGFDSFIILYYTAWKTTWSLVHTMLISPRHSSGLIACGLENPKVAYRMTVVGMQNVTSDTNNHKFSAFTKMTGQGRSNDVNHTTAMRL